MKKLTALNATCGKLPQATKDFKWGKCGKDQVFSVGGKMFACFDNNNHLQFSFKTAPEQFERLTELDGVIPGRYVARYHWVAVTREAALPQGMLKESHRLVAAGLPARLRKQLGPNEA